MEKVYFMYETIEIREISEKCNRKNKRAGRSLGRGKMSTNLKEKIWKVRSLKERRALEYKEERPQREQSQEGWKEEQKFRKAERKGTDDRRVWAGKAWKAGLLEGNVWKAKERKGN
jgi:hypothetical protein